MIKHLQIMAFVSIFAIVAGCQTDQSTSASSAKAAKAANAQMDQDAKAALKSLYSSTPQARVLAQKAKGILVFPEVLKAGLIVGAHHGEGELIENGKVTGYFSTTAASYGLQAGAQKFGYVMFFMTYSAMNDLKSVNGFEVGVGPSIVVVDSGVAKSLTTSTAQSDVYAFIFDQKGLMAGLGLQGSKITRLDR
ncbi:twin-arginine translocation pathway signal protein [Pseudomonas putida]|uniref:Twin-arginine translocation pathway signal protein n=1 Tax=Pseudomonas putida TaxID=303 RepID=A0A2Z4RI40_PSEPU|nr:lipid-binding SYLF domain-containing protein [Pseudomonas putida]AWY40365.1 twin-arginine translocation pathway signal protein [Pseudomonas putida]